MSSQSPLYNLLQFYQQQAVLNCTQTMAMAKQFPGSAFPWSQPLVSQVQDLESRLSIFPAELFQEAVNQQATEHLSKTLAGIEQLLHAYGMQERSAQASIFWQEGTTMLRDYAPNAEGLSPVLFVPSLINRAYILDLSERHSLLRFLSDQGVHPFLLEWNTPDPSEYAFTMDNYIERLIKAIEVIYAHTGQPITLVGYCMGGIMALAAAGVFDHKVASLVLMATPWDFTHTIFNEIEWTEEHLILLKRILSKMDYLPGHMIDMLFYFLDPGAAQKKFAQFSDIDPTSAEAATFIAVEQWLHDSMPLVSAVAIESVQSWLLNNQLLLDGWSVLGSRLELNSIKIPSLVISPTQDRIVMPASSTPFLEGLPNVSLLAPDTGHIGMIVGQHAHQHVWLPLVEWIKGSRELLAVSHPMQEAV